MKKYPLLIVKKKSLFSKEISTFYFVIPNKRENLIQILIDELDFSPANISAINIVFWDWRENEKSFAMASVTSMLNQMYQIEFFKDECKIFSEGAFIVKPPETYITHENPIIRDFVKTLFDRNMFNK